LLFLGFAYFNLGHDLFAIVRDGLRWYAMHSYDTANAVSLRAFVEARIALTSILVVLLSYGLKLIFDRADMTRAYWLSVLPAILVTGIGLDLNHLWEAAAIRAMGRTTHFTTTTFTRQVVVRSTVLALWFAYWWRSATLVDGLRLASLPMVSRPTSVPSAPGTAV
jgi:hypothetical protein